ncbi:MAG TPA: choice-of-anchor tandem repeat GloVer-containing protein [Terriglobales bacterium]|jgi:uncharacterized repeat protein (TIGR03803 family)|nr:choice-of-anchor tandem repeat GloVer-containing protein [Terriglobales bacterium]
MKRLPTPQFLAALLLIIAGAVSAATAQTYTDLYDFDGTQGLNPSGPLTQGEDGNLYGTTPRGGSPQNEGVVFQLTPSGAMNVLHIFRGGNGGGPMGGLTLGTDGRFYGTTSVGGPEDAGTIFRGTTSGGVTLYDFEGLSEGSEPYVSPIEGFDGNFYGTTVANAYKITGSGAFTSLAQLPGEYGSRLLQASDGNFYGTTSLGGDHSCNAFSGCGTIFRLTSSGNLTVVHVFEPTTYGQGPNGGLIEDSDGSLYGTTEWGSKYGCECNDGNGIVFRLGPHGAFTVVHNFGDPNYPNDGMGATGGLVQATDGNFYGTTDVGGTSENCQWGCGVIFKITPEGDYSILYNFDGIHGSFPSNLMQHTNGELYGLASSGGASDDGVVYSFNLGLSPFVAFVVPAGRVGQTGGILGQGFTGTTNVTINGTSAVFNVISDTYLTATVPPGATTGFVSVTTPSGTLTSNVPFRVLP